MATLSKQYSIEFTEVTAYGNIKRATMWFNSIDAIPAKYHTALDAKVVERERPAHVDIAKMVSLRFDI